MNYLRIAVLLMLALSGLVVKASKTPDDIFNYNALNFIKLAKATGDATLKESYEKTLGQLAVTFGKKTQMQAALTAQGLTWREPSEGGVKVEDLEPKGLIDKDHTVALKAAGLFDKGGSGLAVVDGVAKSGEKGKAELKTKLEAMAKLL